MDSNSIRSVSLVLYIIATVSFPAYYAQGSTNSDSSCPYGYFYNNTRTTVQPTTESSTAAHANDSTTLGTSPPSIHPSEGTTIDPSCYPCESHTPNCTGCHYSDGNFTCTNCSYPGTQLSSGSCTSVFTTTTVFTTTVFTTTPPSSSFPTWAIIVVVVVPVVIIIAIIAIVVFVRIRKKKLFPPLPILDNDDRDSSNKIPAAQLADPRYVPEPVQSSLERIPSVAEYDRFQKSNEIPDDKLDEPPDEPFYGNMDVLKPQVKHGRKPKPEVQVDEIYTNEDHVGESTEELYLNNEDARREVGRGIDNTAYDGGYMNKEELDRARKQAGNVAKEATARLAAKSAQKSRPINTGPSDQRAGGRKKKTKPEVNDQMTIEYRPRVKEPTVQGPRDSMFPPGQDGGDELYGNQEEFAKPRTPAVKEDYGQIYANT